MTTTAKFPTTALTLAQAFGEMPNYPELVLSGIHNASTTSIIVTTAIPAGWPQVGWITIDSELMRVTSWAVSTFTVAARDGSAANSQTTTAASHSDGAKVGMYLTALQWNQIVAEVIALETEYLAALGSVGAQWTWTWIPGLAIQSDLTGTGIFTNPVANINSLTQLSTGGTSGSLSGVRKQMRQGSTGANGVARVRRWEFSYYSTIDANTNLFIFLTDENAATAPLTTAKHMGIKQVGAVTSFSTGDGATEQTTDISAFVTSVNVRMVVVTFDGTTARCYVDGTLRATHATNVPTTAAGVDPEFHATIANTAAASKDLYMGITSARFAF